MGKSISGSGAEGLGEGSPKNSPDKGLRSAEHFANPLTDHTFTAMIKSMTGFGKGKTLFGSKIITVDIRSLNSKQLDVSLRIPASYRSNEGMIRNALAKELERGKIDFSISVKINYEKSGDKINRQAIVEKYHTLKSLSDELGGNSDNLLGWILAMPPDPLTEASDEVETDEWNAAFACISSALGELNKFRTDEGNGLQKELHQRVHAIRQLLSSILPHEESRMQQVRAKLKSRLQEIIPATHLNENRFEEELIYYLEKLDISEEKQRLESHCAYFMETMEEAVSAGRKLGFIAQEMGREINTIGSKANHAEIQKIVVLMKDELEKIKEQLNNVL